MKGFTLSKQGIIVGAFSIALSCIGFLNASMSMWTRLNADTWGRILSGARPYFFCVYAPLMAGYAAAAIFSILLICGVVKRRLALMTPWLIGAFAAAAYFLYTAILRFPNVYNHLVELLPVVGGVGVEILILYPMCSLIREINHQRMQERKQQQEALSKIGTQ